MLCNSTLYVFSLFLSTLPNVGDPLHDLRVIRNEPAVRLIVFKCARVIAEIHIAKNRKISVRILEVGGLRKCRLITGTRLSTLLLEPLQHAELVVSHRVRCFHFDRLMQTGYCPFHVTRARVCDAEIGVRGL